MNKIAFLGFIFTLSFATNLLQAMTLNGFDIEEPLVPVNEILRGGPPKDGIPAINNPKFIAKDKVSYLTPDDRVLGVEINGEAKAYPIRILNWHEIVNDTVAGQRVSITFCPLCGSGMAFKTNDRGFGVSGLLYQSDVLLYDYKTESLWSQILAKSISGDRKGQELEIVPIQHTTWKHWTEQFPNTQVLSLDTGFFRDYTKSPYESYLKSQQTMFPVNNISSLDIHPKQQVLGVEVNGEFKAYPLSELHINGESTIKDKIAGRAFSVIWDEESQSARVEGRVDKSLILFWFAWYGFHPTTEVYFAPPR